MAAVLNGAANGATTDAATAFTSFDAVTSRKSVGFYQSTLLALAQYSHWSTKAICSMVSQVSRFRMRYHTR
jgi:hypothetical protein